MTKLAEGRGSEGCFVSGGVVLEVAVDMAADTIGLWRNALKRPNTALAGDRTTGGLKSDGRRVMAIHRPGSGNI